MGECLFPSVSEVPQDCCKVTEGFLGRGREGTSKFNTCTMAECLLNREIVTLLKTIHNKLIQLYDFLLRDRVPASMICIFSVRKRGMEILRESPKTERSLNYRISRVKSYVSSWCIH